MVVSQSGRVSVVVVVVVVMYIRVMPSLCWTRFWTRIPMMTVSRYVIAGPLLVLPTLTDYFLSTDYCPKEIVNDFGLRRPFYSKLLF